MECKTIYYLTRSYSPYDSGGGALMRAGAVKNLVELGWNVKVVRPNYESSIEEWRDNVLMIPFVKKHRQKLSSLFERVGIYEDYLDKWVENAFDTLRTRLKKEDFVFSTSGGELGMIKLGSRLKDAVGCKFIINFRDPLNYGYAGGLRRDKKFHIGRENVQEKYMANADLILTSSKAYASTLKEKYPEIGKKLVNNYFGYVKSYGTNQELLNKTEKLRVCYAGLMSPTQCPEALYYAIKDQHDVDVEIYYIGDFKNYAPIKSIKDPRVKLVNSMPHNEFLSFMQTNIDVGFVSLSLDYYGLCVPSKIYEYINLGLPILGALPDGDAKSIINDNGYGMAVSFSDQEGLRSALAYFLEDNNLGQCKEKIWHDREQWSMKCTIREVHQMLMAL